MAIKGLSSSIKLYRGVQAIIKGIGSYVTSQAFE
jgi:hypothetical protein